MTENARLKSQRANLHDVPKLVYCYIVLNISSSDGCWSYLFIHAVMTLKSVCI